MISRATETKHEAAYQDLVTLVTKHGGKLTPAEILAIAANLVGKLIAMQDQRTMTRERAMEIVAKNMELGNQQVVNELLHGTGGCA